ncbi:MAG: FAD-dependent monooxygenase [Proteobacteria bacterium]|nr:FAD-dependent monooxygenase [Pseudomonadota bacterium]
MRRACIVGAGIGGLACAAALLRRGWRVDLVERSEHFAVAGAGLMLQPNALRALDAIAVRPEGKGFERMALGNAKARLLTHIETGPSLAVLRGDLHRALAEAASGAQVHFGSTAVEVGPSRVVTSRGVAIDVDHVIAADGLGSELRSRLAPKVRRLYSGYTCWRAIVDVQLDGLPCEYWGRGLRMGVVPLQKGTYVYLTANAGRHAPSLTRAQIIERFAGFAQPLASVLQALPEDVLHHDLDYLDAHVWWREGVWFLGDAAHGFTPNLGQGAATALEDALELARCLDEGTEQAYVERRRGRVRRVADRSQRAGWVGQWSNPVACWIRDAAVEWAPSPALAA